MSIKMKDITDWSVIKKLDNDFVKQFKFVHIFNSGNSVIIITNDDCVYVCGNNDNGCLGLGHTDSVEVPTKLDQLCHKQVIHIIDSDTNTVLEKFGHMMYALTSNGVLYHWGYSNIGTVHCNGDVIFVTPTVIESLSGKFIVDIKCGYRHWLALTMNGEVYQWGLIGFYRTICFPKLVFGLKLHTIIAISCGSSHSLALNDSGEVFSWGRNYSGQLGCDSYGCGRKEPVKVEGLGYKKVIKISCGNYHSLALKESGDLYAFGANYCGQLGDNSRDDKNFATEVTNTTKFVDIATLGYECMSIGLSCDGYCYVWGKVDEEDVIIPNKTQFNNIEDVLQNYSEKRITYKSLYFKKKFNNFSVYEILQQSFDKQEFCDYKFKFGDKQIYAKKSHLKAVCQHFNTMIENNAKEMEIKEYSYSVYYSFLKYLYTDSVDIQSKHLIELYYLADSYNEDILKRKCIEIMKMSTNVNNVSAFHSFTVEKKFVELEKYFYDYMISNMSEDFNVQSFNQTEDNLNLKKLIELKLRNYKNYSNSTEI